MKSLLILCFVVWMICVVEAVGDEKKCVSPFKYEGKTYNSRCTYAGDAERPWCSYDYEYNGRWAHCRCTRSQAINANCPKYSPICVPPAEGEPVKCSSVRGLPYGRR